MNRVIKGICAKSGIALLLTAALLAVPSGASASIISLLNNGDFETAFTAQQSIPNAVGKWATGDPASGVGPDNGINPFGGNSMLKFTLVGSSNSFSDDVYQVIDLNAYASGIDTGLATIDATAYFNAATFSNGFITIYATKTLPTSFAALGTHLAQKSVAGFDNNKETWQLDQILGVKVPVDTRYLFFGLNHTAYSDTLGSLPVAYADNAGLTLTVPDGDLTTVPEPSTFILYGGGLGLFIMYNFAARRRFKKFHNPKVS